MLALKVLSLSIMTFILVIFIIDIHVHYDYVNNKLIVLNLTTFFKYFWL